MREVLGPSTCPMLGPCRQGDGKAGSNPNPNRWPRPLSATGQRPPDRQIDQCRRAGVNEPKRVFSGAAGSREGGCWGKGAIPGSAYHRLALGESALGESGDDAVVVAHGAADGSDFGRPAFCRTLCSTRPRTLSSSNAWILAAPDDFSIAAPPDPNPLAHRGGHARSFRCCRCSVNAGEAPSMAAKLHSLLALLSVAIIGLGGTPV
jgi:hypothetical protein